MAFQTKRRYEQTNSTIYASTADFIADLPDELKNTQTAHSANITSITNTFIPSYDSSNTLGNVMQQVMIYDNYENYKYYQTDLMKAVDAAKANSTTIYTEVYINDFKEI